MEELFKALLQYAATAFTSCKVVTRFVCGFLNVNCFIKELKWKNSLHNTIASLLGANSSKVVLSLLILGTFQLSFSNNNGDGGNPIIITVSDGATIYNWPKKGTDFEALAKENKITVLGEALMYDAQTKTTIRAKNTLEQVASIKVEKLQEKMDEAYTEIKKRLPEPQPKPDFIFNDGNSSSSPFFSNYGFSGVASVVVLHYDFAALATTPKTPICFSLILKIMQHRVIDVAFYFQSSYSYFFSRPPPILAV